MNTTQEKKTYWKSHEEAEGLKVFAEGEFARSPLRDDDTTGLDDPSRREFLKVMGASLALMGTAACTRRPVEKIVPYLKQPEELTPGVANWYASTCRECDAACGILVKTREGRPIKFEGNPKHPYSKGALCAEGQASVLNLYDPDRLQSPLKVGRKGVVQAIKWEALDGEVISKLRDVRLGAGRVRVLTGELASPSTNQLIQEFVSGFKNGRHVTHETLSAEEVAAASELSFGRRVVPHYHFEKARMIVSFGADFLGTWLSSVEYNRGFAANRRPPAMSRFVAFEPVLTLTGTNADDRYAVRSGDEYKAALALAHELIVGQKRSRYATDERVTSVLRPFAPVTVTSHLGIPAEVFKKTATELWSQRGKGLVVGGGNTASGDTGVYLELAVNLLNSALENEGVTVDGTSSPSTSRSSLTELQRLVREMAAGQVDALIIHGTNPAYSLPASLGFEAALAKVPLVIVHSTHVDETARLADYACASPHHTEAWGDASPYTGLYSIQQPTIAPLYATRDFEESLMTWAKQLGLSGAISAQPSWHAYLMDRWKQTVYREARTATPFPLFWESILREGTYDARPNGASRPRTFDVASLAKVPKLEWQGGELSLVLYPGNAVYDGRNANNGWLQELPDPVTKITWDNYLSIAPKTAERLGVKEGAVLKVRSGNTTLELPAHIQPGMHEKTVAAAIGYGRVAAGRVGNGVGVNVLPFAAPGKLSLALSALPVSLEKAGKSHELANTQGHHELDGRPIVREASLAAYEKNPKAGNEAHHELTTMWPQWEYKGNRWAMAIDLNSCTGCSACVIACQAENNVPIVGRKHVLQHKEMHWLRIDRYYSGRADNPETVHQPMLCQHCENAPCETVCPVLAAVHGPEGLNQQVYNRCVGTRYCENNCPYKVRRFNWFTFTDLAKPQNLVYNPDVTVRTRGVMEKCTFCIQRITVAKDKARDEGRPVADGEVKTACQQTCPTDAIIFGNINDKNSRVAKIAADPRGYRVLEELNVRSSITYLTKIRNNKS